MTAIPKLEKGHFSVVVCQHSSGIVLNSKDLTVFHNNGIHNENEMFSLFDSLTQAKQYAIQTVDGSKDFECCVYDYKGACVFYYTPHGESDVGNL